MLASSRRTMDELASPRSGENHSRNCCHSSWPCIKHSNSSHCCGSEGSIWMIGILNRRSRPTSNRTNRRPEDGRPCGFRSCPQETYRGRKNRHRCCWVQSWFEFLAQFIVLLLLLMLFLLFLFCTSHLLTFIILLAQVAGHTHVELLLNGPDKLIF